MATSGPGVGLCIGGSQKCGFLRDNKQSNGGRNLSQWSNRLRAIERLSRDQRTKPWTCSPLNPTVMRRRTVTLMAGKPGQLR